MLVVLGRALAWLVVTLLQEELNDEGWKKDGCERKKRGSERLYIGQQETIHSL